MIKSIFVPKYIGTYAIGSQRIWACEINRYEIKACLVRAQGKKRFIEGYEYIAIAQDPAISYGDQLKEALMKLQALMGRCDLFFLVVPGSHAILKEVEFPFIDADQIKKIVPFEIDKYLPFSSNEAYIDSLVTKKSDRTSRVLVAAGKRDVIDEYLAACEQVGIRVDKVTIDAFEWYSLLSNIPEYSQLPEPYVVIDSDLYATRLIVMHKGVYLGSRYLPRGIHQAQLSFDYAFRHGVNDPSVAACYQAILKDCFFTMQSLAAQHGIANFSTVYLAGCFADIQGMQAFAKDILLVPVEKLYAHKIIHNGVTSILDQRGIRCGYEPVVAAALFMEPTAFFNVCDMVESANERRLKYYQIMTTLLLSGLLLALLVLSTVFAVLTLKREAQRSELELIERLKKTFSLGKSTGIDGTLQAARLALAKEKNIWFSLSTGNRYSYLTYLQELFGRIDRDGLGLDIRKLAIKSADGVGEDIMIIEGSVKTYDALRKLEESLEESKLFKVVPRLQETKFTLNLVLDKAALDQ